MIKPTYILLLIFSNDRFGFKMILKFINRFWHLLFVLLEVLLLILVMFWLMVTPMVAENIVYVLLPLVFVVLLIIFIVKRIRNIFAKKSEVPSEITVPDDCVVCLPEFNPNRSLGFLGAVWQREIL